MLGYITLWLYVLTPRVLLIDLGYNYGSSSPTRARDPRGSNCFFLSENGGSVSSWWLIYGSWHIYIYMFFCPHSFQTSSFSYVFAWFSDKPIFVEPPGFGSLAGLERVAARFPARGWRIARLTDWTKIKLFATYPNDMPKAMMAQL